MKLMKLVGLFAIVATSGCQTYRMQQEQARNDAAASYNQERMRVVQGRVESMESENSRLLREVQELRAEVNRCNSQISQLNSNMQALEAKQVREMKKTIAEVEKILNSSSRRGSSSNRGPGRMHTVQSGHTLSTIAQAYGSTVKTIKKANNLDSDVIFVGQKLFIPE